ncbi:hypothetical protein [Streptomyces sp. NPDC058623]
MAAGAETPAEHALRTAIAATTDPTETLTLRRHVAWLTAGA